MYIHVLVHNYPVNLLLTCTVFSTRKTHSGSAALRTAVIDQCSVSTVRMMRNSMGMRMSIDVLRAYMRMRAQILYEAKEMQRLSLTLHYRSYYVPNVVFSRTKITPSELNSYYG